MICLWYWYESKQYNRVTGLLNQELFRRRLNLLGTYYYRQLVELLLCLDLNLTLKLVMEKQIIW